jgi:hypothetical protein
MEVWILVDNRALLRVDDISAITIDDDINGYAVFYRNRHGAALHCTKYADIDEAQHAIAEFMLNLSEPENAHKSDQVKDNLTVDYWSSNYANRIGPATICNYA